MDVRAGYRRCGVLSRRIQSCVPAMRSHQGEQSRWVQWFAQQQLTSPESRDSSLGRPGHGKYGDAAEFASTPHLGRKLPGVQSGLQKVRKHQRRQSFSGAQMGQSRITRRHAGTSYPSPWRRSAKAWQTSRSSSTTRIESGLPGRCQRPAWSGARAELDRVCLGALARP
jgi:hypothetical protein